MPKVVVSLHDQATELNYPAGLEKHIELLFGLQAHNSVHAPNHVVSIRETGPDRFSINGGMQRSVCDDLNPAELLDALLEEIVHSLIYELDTAVALHSASIAWRGHSILIPGPTGIGKTSLAGWFVAKDFEFLSDELTVLPGMGKAALTFPRPLLVKPGAEELIALLRRTGRGQIVRTGASTIISLQPGPPQGNQERQVGLIVFPNFVPGSELEFASVSPAMAGLKLMECNLNARNLPDHGLRKLATFAGDVPALILTYGGYAQLDGVADTFVKFILESGITVAGLQNFISAFRQSRSTIPITRGNAGKNSPEPAALKTAIPEATPRKPPKKITIGMATYDDYDGVYFSIQAIRLFHPEILDETEFLVIDNHPDGPCGAALKALENSIPNYRYVPKGDASGTAIRDCVFEEAGSNLVLCMDCHIFIVKGALKRLIGYFDAHSDTKDLLQGPLLYDDLKGISTHFKPEWRAGMYGIWSKTSAGSDPDDTPFEITMQGLGLFACRPEVWPRFNPTFRGFGGEEGYIHEKFRRRGGRTLCLPFLRWMHRFNRPLGVPYPNRWEDRLRNYVIGFRELGWNTEPVAEHFKTVLSEQNIERVFTQLEEEAARSGQTHAGKAKHNIAPDPFASVWDDSARAQQRGMLQRVVGIAEAHQLALYLSRGTLLGHVREGRILPWDGDVDLALFDPCHDRYDAFRAAIEASGLQIFDKTQDADVRIRICDPTAPVQSHDCPWTWPFVDIFIYSGESNATNSSWPISNVPLDLVLPGRIAEFERIRCWEPEQPLAVLDLQYQGWRHVEQSSPWNHRREERNGTVSTRSIVTDEHGRKIRPVLIGTEEHENRLGQEVFLPLPKRGANP